MSRRFLGATSQTSKSRRFGTSRTYAVWKFGTKAQPKSAPALRGGPLSADFVVAPRSHGSPCSLVAPRNRLDIGPPKCACYFFTSPKGQFFLRWMMSRTVSAVPPSTRALRGRTAATRSAPPPR